MTALKRPWKCVASADGPQRRSPARGLSSSGAALLMGLFPTHPSDFRWPEWGGPYPLTLGGSQPVGWGGTEAEASRKEALSLFSPTLPGTVLCLTRTDSFQLQNHPQRKCHLRSRVREAEPGATSPPRLGVKHSRVHTSVLTWDVQGEARPCSM